MPDTDLLFMPAAKAAALIRAKKLSPVDYVDSVLKAIEHAQPRLNCFRVVMAEEARRDARAAEKAVTDGAPLGPLHGVPISIKDLVDVKGVPTRHGSSIFADNPPATAVTPQAPMTAGMSEPVTSWPGQRASDGPSLAVMSFANLTGDPDNAYFAEGFKQELIDRLSRLRWLAVIAGDSGGPRVATMSSHEA